MPVHARPARTCPAVLPEAAGRSGRPFWPAGGAALVAPGPPTAARSGSWPRSCPAPRSGLIAASALAAPSGLAAPSALAAPSGLTAPSALAPPSALATPSGSVALSALADPSGLAVPSTLEDPSGLAVPSTLEAPFSAAGATLSPPGLGAVARFSCAGTVPSAVPVPDRAEVVLAGPIRPAGSEPLSASPAPAGSPVVPVSGTAPAPAVLSTSSRMVSSRTARTGGPAPASATPDITPTPVAQNSPSASGVTSLPPPRRVPGSWRPALRPRRDWTVGSARDKNTGPIGSVCKRTRCT